jgi:hypothetical protein
MGVRLFVGGHAGSVQGEPNTLGGDRCFTAVHAAPRSTEVEGLRYLLDSGAFSDRPEARLTPAGALQRQMAWEAAAADAWGTPVAAEAVVSYDLLIDEVWVDGVREKRRWAVSEAAAAVQVTVDAAAYLASQREALAPRHLVLSCQGVDAAQYTECAEAVLAHARPGDWLGYGGWCIIGRWQSWLPEFRRTLSRTVPLVAAAGVQHVHLFGVLWEPAVASLLWIADQHGITVSTDSTAPMLAATRGNAVKAGLRHPHWRGNVEWWRQHLAGLRGSRHYRPWADSSQLQFAGWEAAG